MGNLPKREFLMMAETYQPTHMTVGAWYISEMLDGIRVFWDGGISRGFPIVEIPWANVTDPKTGKMKKRVKFLASGLWSCYGNSIPAPDWFLNLLPCIPLDGVIWAGRDNFQVCHSVCTNNVPESDWNSIEFAVSACPPIDKIFGNGIIKNINTKMRILRINFDLWLKKNNPSILEDWKFLEIDAEKITFEHELATLRESMSMEGRVYLLQQRRLPLNVKEAAMEVERQMEKVFRLGGKGVSLRDSNGCWEPKRTVSFLEYKLFKNGEGR